MNRRMLKSQARERIANARPRPVIAGIFFVLIAVAISFLTVKLMGNGPDALMQKYFAIDPKNFNYTEFVENFNVDAFMRDYARYQPSGMASLLTTALRIMSVIITAGLIIFCLNTLRKKDDASYWNLFDGFSSFGRILILYILEIIFISLWAMLFFFPGIIAYYRYSQAIYLLLDHPEMSAFQCIQESSRLMRGHKWERFSLDLSFIGWYIAMGILGLMGGFIGVSFFGTLLGIWVYPFYHLTAAGYYRTLVNDDLPNNDGWVPEV